MLLNTAASCTQHYSFLTVFSRLWAKSTTFHREFSNPLTFPHSWDKRWQQRTHHHSQYDEQLFDNVRWNVSQILCSLLPPKFSALQDYSLRARIHNLQLPDYTSRLVDSNFIERMLFKNVYKHLTNSRMRTVLYTTLTFITMYVMCIVAFCHLCNKQMYDAVLMAHWKVIIRCSVVEMSLDISCNHGRCCAF